MAASQMLLAGEIEKAELVGILGVTDRHVRRIIQPLVRRGILVTESLRAPWRLAFPLAESQAFFPNLFQPLEMRYSQPSPPDNTPSL